MRHEKALNEEHIIAAPLEKQVVNVAMGLNRNLANADGDQIPGMVFTNPHGEDIAILVFDTAAQLDSFIEQVLQLRAQCFKGKN